MGVVSNLAMVMSSQGQMKEATKLWERALRGKEEILGPGNFETLSTLVNPSVSLLIQVTFFGGSMSTLDASRANLDRALAGYEGIIGASIPMGAVGVASRLAAQLQGRNRLDEAQH